VSSSVARRVLVPFGTRPEIIKLAPVVRALRAAGHLVTTVDTGQHLDTAMSGRLQRDLGIHPDVRLELPAGTAARPGALHAGAAQVIAERFLDLVLALGDTDTVPAYALAARRAGVPFAHLEAGLRSFNERSVEEINRRVAAACARLHFAPTELAATFLRAEGVAPDRIAVVGNPIVDALRERGRRRVPPAFRHGVLVTAHRPTNVDDPVRMGRLVELIADLSARIGPVTFPVHPRTRERLRRFGLADRLAALSAVTLTEPMPYDETLATLSGSIVVVTDSGGLQEEAAYFGVPAVVLRRSTPRWEGVRARSTVLAGLTSDAEVDRALRAAVALSTPDEQERVAALPCPYGDGTTGARVAAILADPATDDLLRLDEPDFSGDDLPWLVAA
jgi:UDP-N-acetylglucosamine 2-epimerase (non-hydrolysing)